MAVDFYIPPSDGRRTQQGNAHLPPEFEAGDAILFDQWFVHQPAGTRIDRPQLRIQVLALRSVGLIY